MPVLGRGHWAEQTGGKAPARPHDPTTDEFAAAILAEEERFGLLKPLRGTYVDPDGSSTSEREMKVLACHAIRCRRRSSGVR